MRIPRSVEQAIVSHAVLAITTDWTPDQQRHMVETTNAAIADAGYATAIQTIATHTDGVANLLEQSRRLSVHRTNPEAGLH